MRISGIIFYYNINWNILNITQYITNQAYMFYCFGKSKVFSVSQIFVNIVCTNSLHMLLGRDDL